MLVIMFTIDADVLLIRRMVYEGLKSLVYVGEDNPLRRGYPPHPLNPAITLPPYGVSSSQER